MQIKVNGFLWFGWAPGQSKWFMNENPMAEIPTIPNSNNFKIDEPDNFLFNRMDYKTVQYVMSD